MEWKEKSVLVTGGASFIGSHLWKLIRAFADRTGVPMLLSTSFNENEPIVNSPAEALDCFLRTRRDRLVLGETVLARESNPC
ncbi:MAG TPA: carbamoyltransferase C-terminal domain-containing protein [Thermoanaerobaculia bacterium]|nr:carbamoyltransferase C-terminal domain-containing protein [Thermoanaerobaculia bacterium]